MTMKDLQKYPLVAISGKKHAGKDTLASHFIAAGYRQYRFADPLKQMLKTMLLFTDVTPTEIDRMIDGDLKEVPTIWLGNRTPREAMQHLGTGWRDMIDTGMWTRMLLFRVGLADGPKIITDCRFQHEFDLIRSIGGTVIKIHRDTKVTVGSSHVSETEMDSIVADIDVFNDDSLDELREVAELLIKDLR